MKLDDDRLADAVNQEPIVFYDCTQSEIMGAFAASGLMCILCTVLIAVAFGSFVFGLLAGLILSLLSGWAVMTWLKNIRQKFYTTWFQEKVFMFKQSLNEFIGVRSVFLNHSVRFGKGARRG